jgi:hypothetical protein
VPASRIRATIACLPLIALAMGETACVHTPDLHLVDTTKMTNNTPRIYPNDVINFAKCQIFKNYMASTKSRISGGPSGITREKPQDDSETWESVNNRHWQYLYTDHFQILVVMVADSTNTGSVSANAKFSKIVNFEDGHYIIPPIVTPATATAPASSATANTSFYNSLGIGGQYTKSDENTFTVNLFFDIHDIIDEFERNIHEYIQNEYSNTENYQEIEKDYAYKQARFGYPTPKLDPEPKSPPYSDISDYSCDQKSSTGVELRGDLQLADTINAGMATLEASGAGTAVKSNPAGQTSFETKLQFNLTEGAGASPGMNILWFNLAPESGAANGNMFNYSHTRNDSLSLTFSPFCKDPPATSAAQLAPVPITPLGSRRANGATVYHVRSAENDIDILIDPLPANSGTAGSAQGTLRITPSAQPSTGKESAGATGSQDKATNQAPADTPKLPSLYSLKGSYWKDSTQTLYSLEPTDANGGQLGPLLLTLPNGMTMGDSFSGMLSFPDVDADPDNAKTEYAPFLPSDGKIQSPTAPPNSPQPAALIHPEAAPQKGDKADKYTSGYWQYLPACQTTASTATTAKKAASSRTPDLTQVRSQMLLQSFLLNNGTLRRIAP